MRQRGFTLVEILIAIAILSIAVMLVFQSFVSVTTTTDLARTEAAHLREREYIRRSFAENLQGMRQIEEGAKKLGLDWIPSFGNFITVLATNVATDLEEISAIAGRPVTADDVEAITWTYNEMGRAMSGVQVAIVAPPVNGRVTVPTACALFPKEITTPPRKWVEARYNLVRWTPMPRGGHFAALEQPELLVDDVRAFFRTIR